MSLGEWSFKFRVSSFESLGAMDDLLWEVGALRFVRTGGWWDGGKWFGGGGLGVGEF